MDGVLDGQAEVNPRIFLHIRGLTILALVLKESQGKLGELRVRFRELSNIVLIGCVYCYHEIHISGEFEGCLCNNCHKAP